MKPTGALHPKSTYVLGIDIARSGADETAYVIIEQPAFTQEKYVIWAMTEKTTSLTQAIGRVINLHTTFRFKKIIVDETGLGSGVTDVLKDELGHVVEGVTFTTKSKADMFNNLKLMMQQRDIFLPDFVHTDNPIWKKLYYQLLSIKYEFNKQGKLLLDHEERSHDDLVCALCLGALYFAPKKSGRGVYITGV